MVAVTTSVPGSDGVTLLPPVIDATVSSGDLTAQEIVWLVAVPGSTVPLRVISVPFVPVVGIPVMLVTATKLAFTVK